MAARRLKCYLCKQGRIARQIEKVLENARPNCYHFTFDRRILVWGRIRPLMAWDETALTLLRQAARRNQKGVFWNELDENVPDSTASVRVTCQPHSRALSRLVSCPLRQCEVCRGWLGICRSQELQWQYEARTDECARPTLNLRRNLCISVP